jgi:uncharacterized membrane protein (DUF373 family)
MAGEELPPAEGTLARIMRTFERAVVVFLMGLLMVVTSLAAIELGWMLLHDLSTTRELLLDREELLQLFGFFLLVLVGVELLTALKVYIRSGMIHVEVVLEVALTAIAQKVIVLDTYRTSGVSLLGEAAIILALAAAYWSIHAVRKRGSLAA